MSLTVCALAIMARFVLCVLALFVAGGLSDPIKVWPQKPADPAFLQKQLDLLHLFYHIHEPLVHSEQKNIASSYDIEKNIEHYTNITAVKIYVELMEGFSLLPRAVPFSIHEQSHTFEAVTLFNVLYSAKDYQTFYNTAVALRDEVNEGLYVYVLSVAIVHRPDTQGIVIPPIYEIFPSFFHNGEIMTTAQRINIHGHRLVEHYPSTYVWDENVVIRWNTTVWPYFSVDNPVTYFTTDPYLNTFYYNWHLIYPSWLGADVVPLWKDRRGEYWWFVHKQILTRYYMERLSNDLGEIPDLGLDVVEQGYTPGLLYHNGIPFPSRPNYYHLDQHDLLDEVREIEDFEHRIRDAIDSGHIINNNGEHVSISNPESIDVLANIIEANVDSPNHHYYQDFISIWKTLLGNSVIHEHQYYHSHVPLVLPSVLEHYQTALRDPAFYMIWKRVLHLFTLWHQHLPHYKKEQLALPSVHIEKVEVDKLVTYFELTHFNVTNHLYLNDHETQKGEDQVYVLAQRPQLNHKVFKVRVSVKSEAAKTVVVKFFLAPKYDSHGYEIPLHINTENFFLLDMFTYDLTAGETVIKRDSTENMYVVDDYYSGWHWYEKVENAVHGKGQVLLDQSHNLAGFPKHLLLPKGRVGGMPFVLMVYISEYRAPKVQYGTGFDPTVSIGLGTGARRVSDDPLGFPLDRPLHQWQIDDLHNVYLQDVHIHHKHTPEIYVPHTE